ncbi:MAG: hypothetical protein COV74_04460 [Candidatus Omnitrophica bacterium CG11_big_fil_rev_8_21_14_0_20_45_26]|uniref:Secretin/TonB short N-terminal domain-containing protein n=1 Tax=Candidatus Abzuiibacterium crystallinum TaxID=1974748 RepID=A0A2H0LQ28_9BACT|nr:MAG: hypothetical protein COV74_04460 [Candidatus Omnitrophica bacterium CG11_big_fil_rev_8_21_14_0_20_45_26]PIW64280.1 MAG: hypothetical protein COW12_06980 [Candidatus Omnitrophica bacterium CG12_big_fil_rev_8_21_14_0_65_45_16]
MKTIRQIVISLLVLSAVVLTDVQSAFTESGAQATAGLQKKIFLDLRDINVVDVLKFLAIEGDINIVTSRNVQGRSTLLLRNVPIQDALDIIVLSNQLAYYMKGDIIYVMTENEYQQLYGENYNDQRKVLTRQLRYVKPSYAASALQSVQSGLGKVLIDEETGTLIMIDTPDKLEAMTELLDEIEKKVETKVIPLSYAKAREVEAQLRTRLDAKSVGSITSDERSNKLFVSAYPERMDEVLPLIEELDSQTKAVLIEARILQITINPKFDFGIDWESQPHKSSSRLYRNLDIVGSFPISSDISTDSSIGTVGKIAVGNLSNNEFTTELKALKQVQNTEVLANPRLMILNGEEANINIGDRVPYVVTTTTGTGNNVSVSEEIKFIDVGISLVVSPTINEDNMITMRIRPEISSQTGTLTTPAGAKIPQVNTTFIESSVVVKSGKTIILGGLKRDDLTKNDKGFPYLSDIPVLGHLFKSRSDTTKRTEIIILITPKIVTGEKDVIDKPVPIKPMKSDAAAMNTSAAMKSKDAMDQPIPIKPIKTDGMVNSAGMDSKPVFAEPVPK